MKMKLVLELQDIPGQLVSVLSPISDLGGNMISIVHDRGVKTEKGLIPMLQMLCYQMSGCIFHLMCCWHPSERSEFCNAIIRILFFFNM